MPGQDRPIPRLRGRPGRPRPSGPEGGKTGLGILVAIGISAAVIILGIRVITEDVITRDNVSVKLNAVLYFRVLHPDKAVL